MVGIERALSFYDCTWRWRRAHHQVVGHAPERLVAVRALLLRRGGPPAPVLVLDGRRPVGHDVVARREAQERG